MQYVTRVLASGRVVEKQCASSTAKSKHLSIEISRTGQKITLNNTWGCITVGIRNAGLSIKEVIQECLVFVVHVCAFLF